MHPEFSFKFLHWSQKLSLTNVRLQIGVLQSDVYWYIHVFVNVSEFIYLTQILTVGGWKELNSWEFSLWTLEFCSMYFHFVMSFSDVNISHCVEQFKHKRKMSTI